MALWAIGYALSAGIVLLAAYLLSPPSADAGWDSFLQLGGVGLALVTSIFAALATYLTHREQQRGAEQLEIRKNLLTVGTVALRTTVQAATALFYALEGNLALGRWQPIKVAKLVENMERAAGQLAFVSEEYRNAWLSFFQAAVVVQELAEQQPSEEKRKELWRERGSKLGLKLRELWALVPADWKLPR